MSTPGDLAVPASSISGYVTTRPPKSPRASNFTDMVFQPGVASNAPGRDLKGRWVASNRVRWHKGLPEKIGGWAVQQLVGSNSGVYIGTVRAACDWASLDGQYWIAFATEFKLYLINGGVLYDITPIRRTANLTNAFSTTIGSEVITVTDANHFANVGDYMEVVGLVFVGGLNIDGEYRITSVIDPNTYTIMAEAEFATSTVVNGGGPVSLQYDISAGLAENGFLTGYGTGQYGEGTYGTARPLVNGIPAKLRTWSLSNWGQDLVASYNNGEIYWWQWSTGPNSPASLISNAPTDVQRILVDSDQEFLIAVGASDVSGDGDPMNIRWCSEANLNDWLPVILPVANSAGGQRLNYGSRMVAALQSRGTNLLWSDTQLYQMQFIGYPNYYGFNELGKCFLVGPNAAIDVNGIVYMMCFDNIMIYDGTLRIVPCDMWETVFGQEGSPGVGFDRSQAEMVYCGSYMARSEVTWFYPAIGTDVMQYITYNYDEGIFYGGTMPRTCYHDASPAIGGYSAFPYGFNGGYFYQHEIGEDEVELSGTNPMYFFLQSFDAGVQTDRPLLINSIIPDFLWLEVGCQYSFLCKEYPRDAAYNKIGPFPISPDCTRRDDRASGAQVGLLIESVSVNGNIVAGQDFRMGVWQVLATPHGHRLGAGNPGSPITP